MTKIQIDDLEKYLEENRDEIDFVVLNWIQTNVKIHCETSYEVDDSYWDPSIAGRDIYAIFSAVEPDTEYSYSGDVEGAIDFAKSYSCWDGKEFIRKGPVLYGEVLRYDPDDNCWPHGNDALEDPDLCNLRFKGLGYYYSRENLMFGYDGPIRKKRYLDEED